MKKKTSKKVDTIEKLDILMVDGFAAFDSRLDKMEDRFDKVDADNQITQRLLERIDGRIAALELVVFGASQSEGGRLTVDLLAERVSKLEEVVYNK